MMSDIQVTRQPLFKSGIHKLQSYRLLHTTADGGQEVLYASTTMKGKGPKLPERRKGATTNAQAGSPGFVEQSPGQPGLQELQQQLNSHPVFRQFVDQPDKLLAVLQHDQVLADAAASNPEVAALLDPSTLRQALSVLQGSPVESQQQQQEASFPGVQRKALMQLQNYAMQLQQARRSGMGPAQLQQQQQHVMQAMQVQPAAGNMDAVSLQGPGSGGMADSSMWDALQQRLNKMQQRSSLLGAMPGVQGSPHSAHLQQQPGSQGQPSPWFSEQVQQQHMQQQQQQVFQVQHPEQQQQQAVPMLQHGRFRDAAYRPFLQHGSSSSMGSPGSSPHVRLARLTMPDGLFSSGSGKIMSPLARVTSPGALTGAAGSGPCLSPGSISALQRRSSSSLSHRVLRHSSATPLDLTDLKHSGSQALNVEQLECGDVIVDITPPTRVTQELAWSTDPTAAYVLEAASSGSFGHLTASDSNTQLPVSTLAATASTPSAGNIASAAAAAAGAGVSVGSGSAGPAPAGAFGGFVGQGLHPTGTTDQQQQAHQLYALPLLGAASTTAQGNAQAVSAEDTSRGDSCNQAVPEVAAAAVTEQPAAAVTATGGRRSSASSRQKASPQKLVLRVATPPQQKQAQGAAQAMQQLHQQQQQQQQQQDDHYSYVDLSDATGRSTVSDSKQARQQQYYQHIHQQQQQQQQQGSQQDSAAATALAGARAAAAAGGSLNARTYYESVEPSNWRPTDVGSAPGDYLELYRRAYCSYADALFPPLWMGLIATLATLQLLPLWQLCLLGVATFWGGMWLMAIKWAGVAPAHLGLSRVTPMLTVCLELMCTGAFVSQVLPVMWLGHSLLCMALLVSSFAMMGLHLTAYLQDPGYTPLPDAEQGPSARHLDAAASSTRSSPSTAGTSSSAGQTAADAAAGEQTPLLSNAGQQQQPQQQAGQPGGGAAGPAAWNGQPMDHCWTCRVKRNLRSKHCPLCKRCVERFDHHCPVLGNCVGAGNHKTFVAFLALTFLSQVLFCQVVSSMLTQAYLLQLAAPQHSVGNLHTGSRLRHGSSRSAARDSTQTGAQLANGAGADAAAKAAAAAGAAVASKADTGSTAEGAQSGESNTLQQATHSSTQGNRPDAAGPVAGAYPEKHKSQGLWLTLQALWAAGSTHMGLLLLLFAQVPTMFMSGFLLFRALALAAANLTVNEWMNRQRYVHLHYTGAGFSNRFDRGVGANCYDFWCGPKLVDYWRLWDAAEQEMQRKGMTVLLPWSPTVLVRFWDLRWSKYQQRLVSSRERRQELQMQRRMQALGLPSHS